MLRKRNLDELIDRLIAQGRVHPPGQQSNEAQQAKVIDDVAANIFEPRPVTTSIAPFQPPSPTPRATSSVYSRDIDGIPLRAATLSPLHTPSGRPASIEQEGSPGSMESRSDNDSRSSNSNNASSPAKTVSTSATSASIHGELAEVVPEIPPKNPARALFAVIKRGLRTPSMESNSSLRSHEANDQPAEPDSQEMPQPEIDFRSALAALQKQYENAEPQHGHPMIDQIVQVARVRRKIAGLDFDEDEKILVASDFTSCAPTLPPRKPLPGERPDRAKQLAMLDVIRGFRSRLASRVHRRIAFLELQGRMGSVIRIEHWYREVCDVVGWRDDEEMQMHWSWRENDGFF